VVIHTKNEQPTPERESAASSVIAKQVGLPIGGKDTFFEMSNL